MKRNEVEFAIAKLFNFRNLGFKIHECDLLIVRKSGCAVEIEIKVSKSDLIADFKKKHKHVDKYNRICEFYYAFPQKLYDTCKDLIPNNVGIIVCDEYIGYNNKKHVRGRFVRKSTRIKNAKKTNG